MLVHKEPFPMTAESAWNDKSARVPPGGEEAASMSKGAGGPPSSGCRLRSICF